MPKAVQCCNLITQRQKRKVQTFLPRPHQKWMEIYDLGGTILQGMIFKVASISSDVCMR